MWDLFDLYSALFDLQTTTDRSLLSKPIRCTMQNSSARSPFRNVVSTLIQSKYKSSLAATDSRTPMEVRLTTAEKIFQLSRFYQAEKTNGLPVFLYIANLDFRSVSIYDRVCKHIYSSLHLYQPSGHQEPNAML